MNTEEAPKLAAVEGSTPDSVTYIIDKEDHTLGNALRYVVMRQHDTEFCGYSVPHPSDKRVNLRLQTKEGVSAHEVLHHALGELAEASDDIANALDQATVTDNENDNASSPIRKRK